MHAEQDAPRSMGWTRSEGLRENAGKPRRAAVVVGLRQQARVKRLSPWGDAWRPGWPRQLNY